MNLKKIFIKINNYVKHSLKLKKLIILILYVMKLIKLLITKSLIKYLITQ